MVVSGPKMGTVAIESNREQIESTRNRGYRCAAGAGRAGADVLPAIHARYEDTIGAARTLFSPV